MSDCIEDIVLAAPALTVAGITVPHNLAHWRVCTNRHSNTDGSSWGWIEGAPGNVCWSNSERFNAAAAGEMVKLHQEWLEQQKTPEVRLIESRAKWVAAKKKYDETKAAYEKAKQEMEARDADLIACAHAAHGATNDR